MTDFYVTDFYEKLRNDLLRLAQATDALPPFRAYATHLKRVEAEWARLKDKMTYKILPEESFDQAVQHAVAQMFRPAHRIRAVEKLIDSAKRDLGVKF